jgi:DNA-binding transcriptional ArsR family regulator
MSGEDVREILDALSEKTRYSILEALSKKPMTGDQIADAVQRSRSTVESHLSTLLRLNLVTRRRDDKKYYYEATPTAQMWLDKMTASKTTGVEAQPSEKSRLKGRPFYTNWFFAPILLGAIYFLIDNFLILPSVKISTIWLFALLFGAASVWFCGTLKELVESLLIASITMSVLFALVVSSSILNLGIYFVISLAILLVLGIPVRFLAKKARSDLRR